jgi:SAM-dependent methyltransferase
VAPKGVSDHYESVAGRYEAACFYDPGSAYHAWLVERTRHHLRLAPDHRLADVGGGAGGFSQILGDPLGAPVLVVEPSPGLRAQAAARPGVEVQGCDALEFALADGPSFDRILMKEVVHHLDLGRLDELYAGLGRRLRPGGLLLTITRPVEPSYPLFAAARQVWRDNQPPASLFAQAQERAGLSVSTHEEVYPLHLSSDAWAALIRTRCWSTFADFDDAALEAGIAEIAAEHPQAELAFEDRLILLTALK